MVSWDVVCRCTKVGGLGVLDAQIMNMSFLMKWVARLMSQQNDFTIQVLKDSSSSQRCVAILARNEADFSMGV